MALSDEPRLSQTPLPLDADLESGSETPAGGVIYSAMYANVPVYEFLCKGVQVMRRRSDSYMNATQLLKVANFNKGQRTKILEAEVHIGVHEKIQGGYGKYQGVEGVLRPVLDFMDGSQSPPLAPKPVKRCPRGEGFTGVGSQTPVADRDAFPASSVKLTSRERRKPARYLAECGHTSGRSTGRAPHPGRRPAGAVRRTGGTAPRGLASKAKPRVTPICVWSPRSHGNGSRESWREIISKADKPRRRTLGGIAKRRRTATGAREREPCRRVPSLRSLRGPTAAGMEVYTSYSAPRYGVELRKSHDQVVRELLDYFLSPDTRVPQILLIPPPGLDINLSIDEERDTPLHWAAATARVTVVGFILDNFSVDVDRVNAHGQTALARAVQFRDNFDDGTFPILLDLLQPSLGHIDALGRSILHHVLLGGRREPRSRQTGYYLEHALRLIANTSFRWLLDHPDANGRTPLEYSRRLGCESFPRILLEAGATEGFRRVACGDSDGDQEVGDARDPGHARVPVCEIRVADLGATAARAAGETLSAAGPLDPELARCASKLALLKAISGSADEGVYLRVADAVDAYLKQLSDDHHARRGDTEQTLEEAVRQLGATRQRTEEAKRLVAGVRELSRELEREEGDVSGLVAALKSKMLGNQLLQISALARQLAVPDFPQNGTATPSTAASTPSTAASTPSCAAPPRAEGEAAAATPPSFRFPESDGPLQARELLAQIETLERERRALTDTLVDLKARSLVAGPYQKLVAKCCGVSDADMNWFKTNCRQFGAHC
ncbi:MAG: hypothetical protein BJ554DRAFT_5809 [Olpidium bornovanus]|uniref:HTH APSES-type domain-containing protein n=1 Tax=Olpidium bornovanus TaxID=278681 RepID=A0A8H8A2U8_9FUNG|nr:MAG: hypothetical protein BJ554DRAFT_5809 [Olpidium bornovanus]